MSVKERLEFWFEVKDTLRNEQVIDVSDCQSEDTTEQHDAEFEQGFIQDRRAGEVIAEQEGKQSSGWSIHQCHSARFRVNVNPCTVTKHSSESAKEHD